MGIRKTKSLLLCMVLAVLLTAVFGVSSQQTVSAAPFTCSAGFYQVISGQLNMLNGVTGAYSNVGPVSASMPNALGYNIEDNYMYAMGTADGLQAHLLRYDNDGTFIDLGIPTGLPVDSYVAGDFDSSGNLWVRGFTGTNTFWKVDVSAGTATSLTLSSVVTVSELVYSAGTLYAVNGPVLFVVNATTGVVATHAITGPVTSASGAAYGAGWITADSRLFFSHNNSGVIYEITNFTTASPGSVAMLQGEIPFSNDGASCPNANGPVTGVSAQNKTASVVQDSVLQVAAAQGLLVGATGDHPTVTSNTPAQHGTVAVQADGSYRYTPSAGYVGADSFTYTVTDSFGNTATATVSITVTPLGVVAVLADTGLPQAWVVPMTVLVSAFGSTIVVWVWRKTARPTYRRR